jgi:hypothetical protein
MKKKRKRTEESDVISFGVLNPGKKGLEVPFVVRLFKQENRSSSSDHLGAPNPGAVEYDPHSFAVSSIALGLSPTSDAPVKSLQSSQKSHQTASAKRKTRRRRESLRQQKPTETRRASRQGHSSST